MGTVLSSSPRRLGKAISAFGENKTVARWAADERCLVSEGVLARRIHARWAAEKAITTPFQGPAWQSMKRSTLEEDRSKPAQRTFIPVPGPYKSRKRVRPSGALKRASARVAGRAAREGDAGSGSEPQHPNRRWRCANSRKTAALNATSTSTV